MGSSRHSTAVTKASVPSEPTSRSSSAAESAKRSSAYPAEFLRVRGKRARTSSRAAWSRCQRAVPWTPRSTRRADRSEEHTSELQSLAYLVCRLLLEKKKKKK